ncbi:DUF72 domain-containing protein [Sphingobacterium phlebotomi]|uniref:DUF72 domain-containing protein n=1 Tax=Sphingobacterium phlebotomi TaxID=2605433 RepID=A0A5D4HHP9_9SPHI|nr:DUF72 domain-containing protein [Sphingobacterium phlebotomi]TYR38390.1 DUF72 domain-containing protein [Sphingobacterium phlebotomi]
MKKNKLYIGCSSYATQSWKTLFYPDDLPKKEWFNYYSKHFNTYEFNGSFYKFPTVQNLLAWHDKVPVDFKFSLKVPRIITHIRRLEQCDEEIEEFYRVSQEGLKNKLACILWQLPPSFSYNEDRLKSVLRAMNADFKNVVEFRHKSWWRQDVIKILHENNITFCNVNYPKLPTSIQQTTSIGYVRMHGNPELFYSEYTKDEVETLYHEVDTVGFKEIYIYFNNTASTAAIINAVQLKEISKNKR